MKKTIFTVCLVCVVVGSISPPASAKQWYDYYFGAEKAMKNEEWETAIELFTRAISDNADSGRQRTYGTNSLEYFPYLRLGQAYLELENAADARQHCQKEQENWQKAEQQGKQKADPAIQKEIAACLEEAGQPERGLEFQQSAEEVDTPGTSVAESPATQDMDFGMYYALVIGNNDYEYLTDLETAHNDARAVADLLQRDYGFQVTRLFDATREDILNALNHFRKTLTQRNSLLIYYAGHGHLDPDADTGYWLPVDAERDNNIYWIQNETITATLKAMNARHVLIVSDSCYSGTLTRADKLSIRTPDYFERLVRKKTRGVITSGGLERVMDGGIEVNHSIFATAFLQTLQQNSAAVIDTSSLFPDIRNRVMIHADQEPMYSDIRGAGGDVGGDFVFVHRKEE